MRDGTAQPQRYPPLLAAEGLAVDGLPREERLAFGARFAALLRYYNLQNRVDGSFAPFFEGDVAVHLALIATFQPGRAVDRLRQVAHWLAQAPAHEPLSAREWEHLRSVLRSLLGTVDGWWRMLEEDSPVRAFRLQVRGLIARELAPPLARLLGEARELRACVSGLDAEVWRLNAPPLPEAGAPSAPEREREWVGQGVRGLAGVLERGLTEVVADARHWLESPAVQSAPRAPHLALFDTFLHLLEYPLQRMNALPARHLSYYYEEVLRQAPRPAAPDRALVTFQLTRDARPVLLPAGTLLAAGKDSRGRERRYRLRRDTSVDTAAVARVLTLYRGPVDAKEPDSGTVVGFRSLVPDKLPPGASFPAFGAAPSAAEASPVGFALSSPALLLGGGVRILILTVKLGGERPSPPPQATFRVRLSGREQWIDVPAKTSREGNLLTLIVELEATHPPVVPYRAKVLGPGFPEGSPVLQALLVQGQGAGAASDLFASSVESVHLSVDVHGTRAFTVAGATGPLALGKPFAPFGYAPAQGARFLVGCPEAFQKRLRSLALHLSWLNLPDRPQFPFGFADYYSGYELALGKPGEDLTAPGADLPPPLYGNTSFTVRLKYRLGGEWRRFANVERQPPDDRAEVILPLFTETLAKDTDPPPLTLSPGTDLLLRAADGAPSLNEPAAGLPETLTWDALPPSGVLGVWLEAPSYGFGQALYPPASSALALRTMRSLLEAKKNEPPVLLSWIPWARPGEPKAVRKLPAALSPPYTPMVEELTLDYSAEAVLDARTRGEMTLLHVGPLGTVERPFGEPSGAPALLPRLDRGGSLFLGFTGLTASSRTVSCLFLRRGPVGGDPGESARKIAWCYQSGGEWKALALASAEPGGPGLGPQGGFVDETEELRRSGLITFVLPPDAEAWAGQGTPGMCWVRGHVTHPEAFPALTAIRTQGTWCERVPDPLGDQDYDVPLPPGSIKELVADQPAIADVSQPLPSEGGKPPEDTAAFRARVSERTRHKGRAWTAWDYERLVLEAFPWVFAARCLPGVGRLDGKWTPGLPGAVTVLVYPRTYDASLLTADTFPPHVDAGRLREIQEFLARRAPASADVQVNNPVYLRVRVSCELTAASGHEPTVVAQRLNEELRARLSPWVFSPGTAQALAGTTSAARLLHFLKARPEVSRVQSFHVRVEEEDHVLDGDTLRAPNPKPWITLVSDWQHELTVRAHSR